MFDEFDRPRHGRLLEIEGLGSVIEILPFVFCRLSEFDSTTQSEDLIFLRTARIVDSRRSHYFGNREEHPEVSENAFSRAIELLGRGLSITQDFTPEMDASSSPLAFAALLGAAVHANQLDKLGFPYIEHPRRVFLNSQSALESEVFPEEERFSGLQAAWLHDVIEDSQESFYRQVDSQDLANWGLSSRVISLVELLTRSAEDSTDPGYYQQILLDKTARAVKLSDIADNLAKWRTELLDEVSRSELRGKYDFALEQLGHSPEVEGWFETRVQSFDQGAWPQFAYLESHEALRLAKHKFPQRSWLDIQSGRNNFWEVVSEMESGGTQILQNSAWVGRESEKSAENALAPYSLDAWYGALLVLHAKAQSKGDQELLKNAQCLGDFLDRISRDEVQFYKYWQFVPRNINYLQVKLRYVSALSGLHALLNAGTEEHLWGLQSGEPPLSEMQEGQLLDMAAISFSDPSLFWIFDAMKVCLTEVSQRIGR